MSSFLKNGDLWLKCDGCGEAVEVYRNQTDKLLLHDWMKENGWKTVKRQKFENLCPDCKQAFREKKRMQYISAMG